jgi:exosortase
VNASPSRTLQRSAIPWLALWLLGIWIWAIWSCAEHWLGNPNYSFGWVVPPLAFGFGIRRYLRIRDRGVKQSCPGFSRPGFLLVLAFGGLVFLLEYSRQQMWHPQIVLWTICLFAAASTLATFRLLGGRELAPAEIFPVLFFLTAVPWPPRLEQPITSTLMRWVAVTTAEVLHWVGIEAQTSGAAIALRSGLVGITEACSGVRSLQAGIMFGLAMGEWFLLRPARRVALLLIAIVLALATNLVRTLALALQAERHGIDSVDRVHDFIGNVMITTLILAIWVSGRLLAQRREAFTSAALHDLASRGRVLWRNLFTPGTVMFRALASVFLVAILCARFAYARVEAHDQTQTQPRFIARTENSAANRVATIPREIWRELRPTSGEYIRHEDAALPSGGADCYHFFWKPSPWNRFTLIHRPDICMPGVGWELDGPAEPVDTIIGDHSIRFYAFRFRRDNVNALELWGAWRNGEPVPIDYKPEHVFGDGTAPTSLQLQGKRRSATEIVACTVIAENNKPPVESAKAVLQSVFQHKTNE